jgi:hypothetical protein
VVVKRIRIDGASQVGLLSLLSGLIFITVLLLYVGIGIWLAHRGWWIRAGLAMLVIAALPPVAQRMFTESEAPGFAILFAILVPIPLLVIAVGLIICVGRLGGKLSNPPAG